MKSSLSTMDRLSRLSTMGAAGLRLPSGFVGRMEAFDAVRSHAVRKGWNAGHVQGVISAVRGEASSDPSRDLDWQLSEVQKRLRIRLPKGS